MHELLLFGQIPPSRHGQVLKILTGIAAMQPHRVIERHVVYKPTRDPVQPGRSIQVGGSQGIQNPQKQASQAQQSKDLYYQQLVQGLLEEDFGHQVPQDGVRHPVEADDGLDEQRRQLKRPWSIQFYDIPEAGKRPVSMREASSAEVVQGDAHSYMIASGYSYVSEYVLEGHRLIHNNLVILLYRILRFPQPHEPAHAPRTALPAFGSLQPLDDGDGYVVQVTVRLDTTKPDIIREGVDGIVAFQKLMKGIVDLTVPDRLSLDTRVKYRPAP